MDDIYQEGYDKKSIETILNCIPTQDDGGMTYLEYASRSILETSDLIDSMFPDLSREEKLVKKYRLMSRLLKIKADELDKK